RVADDERAASREHRWRAAHRQAVAADIRQPPELDSVLLAEDAEMLPKVRTLLPPPADADVDMVGLGKDPPVPAGDRGELEEKHAPPVYGRKLFVRKVALESDPVDDRAAQSERARGDSVGAVGPDQGVDLDRLAVDAELFLGFHCYVDAIAKGRAGLDGPLDHERVEPPAPRHQAEHARRLALQHRAVPQPAAGTCDAVLDYRFHGERQLPDGAHRQAAAAGLVAGEPCLVY